FITDKKQDRAGVKAFLTLFLNGCQSMQGERIEIAPWTRISSDKIMHGLDPTHAIISRLSPNKIAAVNG
ncbi:hypothetical protein J0895_16280, partial [Phormidium pseudopriestleyi FRX01]